VPFFPGVPALVRALAAEVPVAIASGAMREEIEAILTAGGLRDPFHAIVGAGEVRQGKPHPEPYLTAADLLAERAPGLRPEDCVAFEDSMPGIAAARAAGMKVVAVTNSYPAAKLGAAHRVVDTLSGIDGASLRALFAA
jgi:beta-phosphoglucomutase